MEIQKENNKSQEKIGREKPKEEPPSGGTGPAPMKKEKTTEQKGRPGGDRGTRQTTKKITPVGGSEDFYYHIDKIKDNIVLAQKLENDVGAHLRKKHEKRKLSKKQKEIAEQITEVIIANENPEDWGENIEKYCESPTDKNHKRVRKIGEIAAEHHVDMYLASLLFVSKV